MKTLATAAETGKATHAVAPHRTVRLLRKPAGREPGVLRIARPAAGTATDYHVREAGCCDGRAFECEPVLACEFDPAVRYWVAFDHRSGGGWTEPADGDAGELLDALRVLIRRGEM